MDILFGFALVLAGILGGFLIRALWRIGDGVWEGVLVLRAFHNLKTRLEEEAMRKARLAEAAEQEAQDKEEAIESAVAFLEQMRRRLNASASRDGSWTNFMEPLEVSAIALQFRNKASGEEIRFRFTYDFHYDHDLRMEALGCNFIHFYDGPSAEYKGHPHPRPCGRVFLDDEINECANKLADYIVQYPEGYEAKAHAPADVLPAETKEKGSPFDETLLDLPEEEETEDSVIAEPGFYALKGDSGGGAHLEPNADGQGFSCAPASSDEPDH